MLQQTPKTDRSRRLVVAVLAASAALLVVGTVVLVVALTRNSGSPAVVESGTAPTGSSPVVAGGILERSTTTRPASSTRTSPTISFPTTTPPPTTPTTAPPTAPSPSPQPPSGGPAWFHTPSGNITCRMSVDSARCDIVSRDWPGPSAPASCPLDYGDALEVSAAGADFVCHGDTVNGAPDVLPYGSSSRVGVYVCESRETGVTCRNSQTGHGFFVAREIFELF